MPVCLSEARPGNLGRTICAETITIPEQVRGQDLFVVRIDDDTLAPGIRRGAYLGLDRADKRVRSGGIYGVLAPLEGLVVKRAVVDLEARMVVLHDAAKKQPPYRFPLEEFRQRVVGRVVWVFQDF